MDANGVAGAGAEGAGAGMGAGGRAAAAGTAAGAGGGTGGATTGAEAGGRTGVCLGVGAFATTGESFSARGVSEIRGRFGSSCRSAVSFGRLGGTRRE